MSDIKIVEDKNEAPELNTKVRYQVSFIGVNGKQQCLSWTASLKLAKQDAEAKIALGRQNVYIKKHWFAGYAIQEVAMQVLFRMIHDRAEKTYSGEPITADNYQLWVKHWFATAELLRDEFCKEHLVETAIHIEALIAEERKICGKYI